MNLRNISIPWAGIRWVVVIAGIAIGASTYRSWQPGLQSWVQATAARFRGGAAEHAAESEAAAHGPEAEGAHAGHSAESSVELSKQAMQNLGLTDQYLRPIERSTFRRSIRVPAIVVEKPGVTRTQVATPMTAIVTRLHAVSGSQVKPGQLLFSLRLTHEDLVNSQTDFLKLLGELDVEQRELARLKQAGDAIPPKLVLDREYAIQRLQSQLQAQREALKLHGLNDQLVGRIEADRKLLQTLELYAPTPGEIGNSEFRLTESNLQAVSFESPAGEGNAAAAESVLILEEIRIHQGQAVNAGDTLCILANYGSLYIEGQAFEKDADSILAARERGWPVTAHFEGASAESTITDLPIAFVANAVDLDSRSLHFYVELPNRVLPPGGSGQFGQFVTWKYRPGQRLDLSVPVEEWPDEIVLPVDAVARDGAESYVFLQNGKHFDRKAVHVKHRDQQSVVVANDGTLFPGDIVARRGAYQLQMALKNKSGGGVDPHAGHTH